MDSVLSPPEAERLVDGLRSIPVRDIGSSIWMKQHEVLQKLNVQAHANASASADEFVMESLITFDKMECLVHELLAAEAWTDSVYPLLKQHLTGRNSLRAYFIMYQEATIANLFEVLTYYETACQALGDAVLDLADWCVRKVMYLITRSYERPSSEPAEGAAAALAESPSQSLDRQLHDMRFSVGVVAVTVLRYLTEHVTKLPLGLTTRLLETHDTILLLVPLIENPPWTRRVKGKWEKFVSQKWSEVAPADLLRLTQTEGQVWLTFYNLVCEPECRRRYELTSQRKGTMLRVRKYLNDLLVDQLPVLSHVQRYLDEITIVDPPSAMRSALVLEQAPAVRDSVLAAMGDVRAMAAHHISHTLTSDDSKDDDLKSLASVYSTDAFEQLLGDAKCYTCGKPAAKRCSRCKNVWYCSRECQVGGWKDHKPLCDLVVAGSAK